MKKKTFYLVTYAFTILLSCSSPGTEEASYYVIKVKEHKTNLPLEAVTISLYYCKYDIEFGCQRRLLSTYLTDNKGECRIPKEEYLKSDEGFVSKKMHYWTIDKKAEVITMEPEAWVRFVLKTDTTYPNTSNFTLKTTGELGLESIQKFKTPKDSIIDFRIFGNETNTVDWTVYRTGYPPYCNPCDILAFGTVFTSPQKFESVSTAIKY
jgi:hypothetical protein